MLTRFSSRMVVSSAMNRSAILATPATSWVSRRWQSEEAKKEEEPKEEKAAEKEEPKKEEPKKKAQDAKAHEAAGELETKVKALEKERDQLKKDLLYAHAEAENARRIGRKDTDNARDFAVTGFAKNMLEVADTLDRAIEALDKLPKELVEENKSLASVLTGVKMSESVLQSAFGKHNITKMECKVGTTFDPNNHDALFNAPATEQNPEHTIINVVKSGYNIKERVLRAAQVGVATKQE